MKKFMFIIIFIVSVAVSYVIWDNSPEYLKQGGPLLVIGLTLLFLVFTFTVERAIVLARAARPRRSRVVHEEHQVDRSRKARWRRPSRAARSRAGVSATSSEPVSSATT